MKISYVPVDLFRAELTRELQSLGISETRENYSTGFKMNNNLNGFTLFSQPSRSAAGGVAIYASKSLNAFKRTDLSTTDDEFETVWVEINNTKAKHILCCCAYRHPSFNPVRFKEHLESILSQLTRENENLFIMGDFNINLLTCESHPESNDFILMLNSFFLLPYILQPTRITERSATLIDNIFANTYSMNAISGNLVSKISDHLPKLLIVDNIKVNYKILNYYKNDYTKFDEDKFINEFTVINWENISNTNLDANTKFNIFYDQISQFINSHVPRRKLSKREIKLSTKPWITKEILAKMQYRDKVYSQVLKCNQPDPNMILLYKKLRNCVVKDIKICKSNYLKNYFLCNRNNMRKIWSGIRSIINVSKVKADYIPTLLENGKLIDNSSAIAGTFNNFFVNVGKNTDKDISHGKYCPTSFLKGNIPDSMFLSPVTSYEVESYISQMDSTKFVGPYSIPVLLLKILKAHIAPILSCLINESLLCGIFPEKLKLAKVTPVFKKGSTQDKDNYRPISVLSVFSKIFEKVMYKRLYAYLECHNILYSLQFGFRQKCSTNHAVISIAESIRSSVDNKEFGCGIFIDLKNAFDTVNHSILLLKLHHYGIIGKAYEWFQSYLSNRKQFVCVNGHDSDSLPLTCSVPQGSVLGPLLFLLYVNDLPNTSSLLTFHLFADDTNIYYSCKNLDDLESKLNHELKIVAEWMKSNRLALSILKTNFILFHSKKLKPSKLINLKIDGVNIVQVFTVKYLGVTFDSNLTWKNHINELCSKLSKTVGIFSKLRYNVNIDILTMLYYSLIYPFLIYGVQVWGLTYPTYLTPVTTLQKRIARSMTFSEPVSHSEPLLKSLNLLKFNDIIHSEILSFVYQWFHKLVPSCFLDFFKPISSIHEYPTRQSLNEFFFFKSIRTTQYGIRSLHYTGSNLWNSLPITIKQITPFSKFRKTLKKQIIDSYNNITSS